MNPVDELIKHLPILESDAHTELLDKWRKFCEEPIDQEDFSNYPISVNEAKSNGMASNWEPREALISMLRYIDSNEIKLSSVVICGLVTDEDGMSDIYRAATPDKVTALGLLECTKQRIME